MWKIEDGNGGFYFSQHDLSAEATRFFQKQYMRQQGNINDILWAVDLVPVMYDEAANDEFFKPITEEELQALVKTFKKDKCPGPDGWPIEFFLISMICSRLTCCGRWRLPVYLGTLTLLLLPLS